MSLGEKIKRLRTAKGWSQAELGKLSGVSQTIISRLEAEPERTVYADALKKLALAFGCTTDFLLGMHEEE